MLLKIDGPCTRGAPSPGDPRCTPISDCIRRRWSRLGLIIAAGAANDPGTAIGRLSVSDPL